MDDLQKATEDADAAKLLILADWFDAIQRHWWMRRIWGWSKRTEVQDDLRRIAQRLKQFPH